MGSRFGSRGTFDIPLWRGIFIIMPGGRSCWETSETANSDGELCRECAGGCCRTDYSLELSLLMFAWKVGAGAGCRMHGRDQAG